MKKFAVVLVCFFIIATTSSIIVFASSEDGSVNEILPSETVEFLEQNGFESLDINELKELNVTDAFKYIENIIRSEINTPFLLIYTIFLIILIITIARGLGSGALGSELDNNLGIVGILSLGTIVLTPMFSCLTETKEFIYVL